MTVLRWRPIERFATLHALSKALGADQTNISVPAWQDYRRTVLALKLFKADDAMQGHFGG